MDQHVETLQFPLISAAVAAKLTRMYPHPGGPSARGSGESHADMHVD